MRDSQDTERKKDENKSTTLPLLPIHITLHHNHKNDTRTFSLMLQAQKATDCCAFARLNQNQ